MTYENVCRIVRPPPFSPLLPAVYFHHLARSRYHLTIHDVHQNLPVSVTYSFLVSLLRQLVGWELERTETRKGPNYEEVVIEEKRVISPPPPPTHPTFPPFSTFTFFLRFVIDPHNVQ